MVKIKSKTDIITNSSTEVYMMNRPGGESLRSIKELVNAFLAKGGSPETFDDLFEAESYFNEDSTFDAYEDMRQELDYMSKNDLKPYKEFIDHSGNLIPWDSLTLEQKKKFAETHERYTDLYEPLLNSGYVFKAKDPKDEDLAKILNNIETIYRPEIYSN